MKKGDKLDISKLAEAIANYEITNDKDFRNVITIDNGNYIKAQPIIKERSFSRSYQLELYDRILIIPRYEKITSFKAYCDNNNNFSFNVLGYLPLSSTTLDKLIKVKILLSDKKNYTTGNFCFTFDKKGTGCKILAYTG